MKLAGVVDVGVERGDGEGRFAAGDANALPGERGRNLQRDVGERGFAAIAQGDLGTNGNLMLEETQVHFEIEIGEGDGLAVGVGRRGRGNELAI